MLPRIPLYFTVQNIVALFNLRENILNSHANILTLKTIANISPPKQTKKSSQASFNNYCVL